MSNEKDVNIENQKYSDDSENQNISEGKIKRGLRNTGTWIKAHKTQIFVGVTTTVSAIVLYKNRAAITEWLGSFRGHHVEEKVSEPVVKSITETKPISIPIPPEILEKRTGKMLTATELGNIVGMSAQAINKRIVNAGLAIKEFYGSYEITDRGKELGTFKSGERPWGYEYSTPVWDEAVLELIFSPEEFAARKELMSQWIK